MRRLYPVSDMGWRYWFSAVAPEGDTWPWTLIQEWIAGETLELLATDPYLGGLGGVWHQERRFDVARHLAGRGSRLHSELPANEARAQAVQQLERIGGNPDRIVQLDRFQIAGSSCRN